jgi:hypothetical protein
LPAGVFVECNGAPHLWNGRELPLRHGGSSVYLDLLGVSPTGRLVLIECKRWRNPEARREVVAIAPRTAMWWRFSFAASPQTGCRCLSLRYLGCILHARP